MSEPIDQAGAWRQLEEEFGPLEPEDMTGLCVCGQAAVAVITFEWGESVACHDHVASAFSEDRPLKMFVFPGSETPVRGGTWTPNGAGEWEWAD